MMRSVHLRISAVLLTLSPALYAEEPARAPAPASEPAAAPAAAPGAATVPAPAAVPTTNPAPPVLFSTAPSPSAPAATTAAASAGEPTLEPAHAAARRRTSPNSAPIALAEDPALESNDPSIDLHEPARAPARPIPLVAAWLGFGTLWIPSDGLDPFAEDDALTTFNAGAGVSLASAGVFDVAAVAIVDVTASEENYRGEGTSLGLLRLAAGPELRGSWLDRLYWHGRLAPTLTRWSAELDESSSGATLADSEWLWGAEAAVGLELRFADTAIELPHALAFFARLDAGYGWTPSAELELQPSDSSGAPVRTQPLDFGELALSGPFFRANVGVGF